MKKIVCMLLAGAMAGSTFCNALAEAPIKNDAGKLAYGTTNKKELSLEEALRKVKSRIDIPENFTKFDSSLENTENGMTYYFNWSDEEDNSSISINCDGMGRIISFWRYDRNEDNENATKLSKFSQQEIEKAAEDFVKKALPEAYENPDDTLVYDKSSYYAYLNNTGTTAGCSFNRTKNGYVVSNGWIGVDVKTVGDTLYVSSLSTNYDYDAKFEEQKTLIENPEEQYKKVFPLELIYENDYSDAPVPLESVAKNETPEKIKTNLTYRINNMNGDYISAYTGEKVSEKRIDYREEAGGEDMGINSMGNKDMLTPAEQQEIDNVKNLKTEAEAEKAVRSLPYLKLTDMKLSCSNVEKSGDNEYSLRVDFLPKTNNSGDRNLNATLDAKTGMIRYISNYLYKSTDYDGKNEKITDEQLKTAQKKAEDFTKAAAGDKFKEYELATSDKTNYNKSAYFDFARKVNGIKYINNSIYVTFDVDDDMLSYYSMSYDDAEFTDPAKAVSAESAYSKIFETVPLKLVYVKTDDDVYKLCCAANYMDYVEIDALTGEPRDYNEHKDGNYSDISGHWCETIVKKLAEVGISLNGDSFKPDDAITSRDFKELLEQAITDFGYHYTADYAQMTKNLDENGDKPLSREDACVDIITACGYQDIAKHYEIFTVDFADKNEIDQSKLGYAAILTAMKVVSGDGGALRPKDNLTRAEAVAMVYNYLANN